MKLVFACAVVLLAAGCDPSAKASGEGTRLGDEQRSQLGETCGTSLHCAAGLRCLQQTCRSPRTSTLGEFHAAAGDTSIAANDVDMAIEHYTEAVNTYEADKIEPPAQLQCKLGAALTERRDDSVMGERAARALHRCLLGAPAGSSVRASAMRHLSLLLEVGLDPLLLARTEPADTYLTKAPQLPSIADVKVTAKAQGREPGSRTYAEWIEHLQTPAVKQALAPCWQAYVKETLEATMSVTLSFKYSFRLDQYDDFDRSTLVIGDVAPGSDAAGAARTCMKAALDPIADNYSRGSSEATWRANINITVGE